MKPLLSGLLACLALLVAACGGGGSEEPKPSGSQLLADTLEATTKQKSASYTLSMKIDAKAAANADAQTKKLIENPISLELEGDASTEAFTTKGKVSFLGKDYKGEARANQTSSYVNLFGQWFGDPNKGLQEGEGAASNPQELARAIEEVQKNADKVLNSKVSEGPEVDGEATWQLDATLDPEGAEEYAKQEGDTWDAADRAQAKVIAEEGKLVLLVGQKDNLPRSLELGVSADKQQLQQMEPDDPVTAQAESFDFSFKTTFSDWGKKVEFDAPEKFSPYEQLTQRLFGEFLGAAMGSTQSQPAPAQP